MPELVPATTVPVMRCAKCATLDPGPRALCKSCHGPLQPETVSGVGELISWTMIRRPPTAFREDGPYAVAVVRLDAGVQVTGRLENATEEISPGRRVRAKGRLRDTTVFEIA